MSGALMHPPSPCVSVCEMGPDGLCKGCFRTLTEIARWGTMTNGEKQQVLDRIFDIGYNQESDNDEES